MFEVINDYGKSALHLKDCLSKEECDRLIEFGKLNAIEKRIDYSDVAGGRYLESSAHITLKSNKELLNLFASKNPRSSKDLFKQTSIGSFFV